MIMRGSMLLIHVYENCSIHIPVKKSKRRMLKDRYRQESKDFFCLYVSLYFNLGLLTKRM